MTRLTLELDDETLARVEAVARARQTTAEALLRQHVERMVRLAPIEIHNPSHREILSALEGGNHHDATVRGEANDRAQARAEVYSSNRQKLLELIDRTRGDMGRQTWDRSRIYER
jgi:predicted transcriptional regulator